MQLRIIKGSTEQEGYAPKTLTVIVQIESQQEEDSLAKYSNKNWRKVGFEGNLAACINDALNHYNSTKQEGVLADVSF